MLEVLGDERAKESVADATEFETEGLTLVETKGLTMAAAVERFLSERAADKMGGLAEPDVKLLVGLLVGRLAGGPEQAAMPSGKFKGLLLRLSTMAFPIACFLVFYLN